MLNPGLKYRDLVLNIILYEMGEMLKYKRARAHARACACACARKWKRCQNFQVTAGDAKILGLGISRSQIPGYKPEFYISVF